MSKKTCYILAIVTLVFFSFYRLDADTIEGFDEGRHAVNALEMMERHDPIVSTYNGAVDYYNLKPPLSMYMIMLGVKLFGTNLLGIRFFSAFFFVLTGIACAEFVRRRSDEICGAFCLVLFTASEFLLLQSMARKGDATSLYTCLATIAILLTLMWVEQKSKNKGEYPLLCLGIGGTAGLAFLAKSFHAVMIALVVLGILLASRQLTSLRRKEWLTLFGSGAAPVLLWAVLRYNRDGWLFLKEMLLTDVLQRSVERIAGGNYSMLSYLFAWRWDKACVAAVMLGVITLAMALYLEKPLQKSYAAYWVWVLLPIVLFSIPKTRLVTYVYPSYIGLFVLASFLLWELRQLGRDSLSRWLKIGSLALCCCLLTLSLWGNLQRIQNERPDSFDLFLEEAASYLQEEGDIYINRENPIYKTWYQDDLLAMKLCSPLHCVEGGIAQSLKAENDAYLIVDHYFLTDSDRMLLEKQEGKMLFTNEAYSLYVL